MYKRQRYLLNGTFYADVKLPVKGLSYRVNYSNAMTFYREDITVGRENDARADHGAAVVHGGKHLSLIHI